MSQCPNCSKNLDYHQDLEDESFTPRPYDYSICGYCFQINQFDVNMMLIEAENPSEEVISQRDRFRQLMTEIRAEMN